ncbi:unnamed protein product, partial [Amaranthus hypochondriacus]
MPTLFSPHSLEKNASWFYSHTMFYIFQNEFKSACFGCGVNSMDVRDDVEHTQVIDNYRGRVYNVKYFEVSRDCLCSCKMFESMGMLCRHVIFILKGKNLKEIPKQYMMNRWSKNAMKLPIFGNFGKCLNESADKDKKVELLGHLWSKFFSSISLAEGRIDAMELLLEKLENAEMQIKDMISNDDTPTHIHEKRKSHIESFVGSNEIEINILNPPKSSNKGSGT